ncbi:MAG TPA: thiamine phosphate synthase [Longimicrobiales bacterium]|nr:thiamine phosphate synthase [Longimicrobiales bacterium]
MTLPPLHLVTDDAVLARDDFRHTAAEALGAGGASLVLHLRAPHTDGRTLYRLAAELLPAADASGARLLVNDRVDVAACVGAHGVQLGQRSLPVAVARELLGPGGLVGVSVHSAAEAREAAAPDFLLVGTLFETPSHPGRPGAGTGLLHAVAVAARGIPLVGIGGVTPERLAGLRAAGAHGFAVLRGVWDATSPATAVQRYLTLWQEPK